ncbi:MAG: HD domain-containing protein [Veillonellales bacterium]
MKVQFTNLLRTTKREGIEELLCYLETTDFYTAPASTRYHGAVKSGLLAHSLAVCNRIMNRIKYQQDDDKMCSAVLVALLHDICKANFYAVSSRNVKDDVTGKWHKEPYYTVEDQLPMGHGEKSLYIVMKYIKLSDEEAAAIRWHMGFSDEAFKGGSYAVSNAMDKYPLVVALHIADLEATYFDKK